MTKEDIEELKGKKIEVDVLDERTDGNRLCFVLYNVELGKFVISICDYTENPKLYVDYKNHLYGSISMELSDGLIHYIQAVLNINKDNSSKGFVEFT